MIISHSKKFIFIHNYKVAGTSVRNALQRFDSLKYSEASFMEKAKYLVHRYPNIYSKDFNGHVKAEEVSNVIPAKIFNNYYKFGFVRNPWDWQVSLYTFMLKKENHHQHSLIKSFKSFDEYIDWRVHEDLTLQKSFFYSNEECLMDFVGKFENLDKHFLKVCNILNIDAKLPYLNKSRDDNKFLGFYSKKSIEMVNQAYKKDIELFGYTKPIL